MRGGRSECALAARTAAMDALLESLTSSAMKQRMTAVDELQVRPLPAARSQPTLTNPFVFPTHWRPLGGCPQGWALKRLGSLRRTRV